MKKKLSAISVLLVLCMMITLAACGPEPEAPEEPVERAEIPHTEPDLTETDELVIWSYDFRFGPYQKQAHETNLEEMFQEIYPNVNVTVEYMQAIIEPQDSSQFSMYLKKDWGSEAPDLIWVANFPGYSFTSGNIGFYPGDETYQDVYELIEDGRLLDLNAIIEEDDEFDISLYDEGILSAGNYRGGRYLIPLGGGTNVTTLLGAQEALEQAGFSESAWNDSVSFIRELSKIQQQGNYENVIADSGMYKRLQQAVFDASNPPLVDREQGIVTVSREGLKDFCQAWKELFYDSGLDRNAAYAIEYPGKKILKDQYLFQLADAGEFYAVSGVKSEKTPVFRNIPSLDGTVVGDVTSCLGICADGENQLNAWRFIKLMMSETIQGNATWAEDTLPAVLSVQEDYVQNLLAKAESIAEKSDDFGQSAPLTESEQSMCRTALTEVDTYRIASPAEFMIFTEQMAPYFVGKETYEDCIENLKAALREYLAGK